MESLNASVPEAWSIMDKWNSFMSGVLQHTGKTVSDSSDSIAAKITSVFVDPSIDQRKKEIVWLVELLRNTLYDASMLSNDVHSRLSVNQTVYSIVTVTCIILIFVVVAVVLALIFAYNISFALPSSVGVVVVLLIGYVIMLSSQNSKRNQHMKHVWKDASMILGSSQCEKAVTFVDLFDTKQSEAYDSNDADELLSAARKVCSNAFPVSAPSNLKVSSTLSTPMPVCSNIDSLNLSDMIDKGKELSKLLDDEFSMYTRMQRVIAALKHSINTNSLLAKQKIGRRQLFVKTRDAKNEIQDTIVSGVVSCMLSDGDSSKAATRVVIDLRMYDKSQLADTVTQDDIESMMKRCMSQVDRVTPTSPLPQTMNPNDAKAIKVERVAETMYSVINAIQESLISIRGNSTCDARQLACIWKDMSNTTIDRIIDQLGQVKTDVDIMYAKFAKNNVYEVEESNNIQRMEYVIWSLFASGCAIGIVNVLQSFFVSKTKTISSVFKNFTLWNYVIYGSCGVLGFIMVILIFVNVLNRAKSRSNYNKTMMKRNTRDISRGCFDLQNLLTSKKKSGDPIDTWSGELLMSITSLDSSFSNCNMLSLFVGKRPGYPVMDVILATTVILMSVGVLCFITLTFRPATLVEDARNMSRMLKTPVPSASTNEKMRQMWFKYVGESKANAALLKQLWKDFGGVAILLILLLMCICLGIATDTSKYESMLKSLYQIEKSCA